MSDANKQLESPPPAPTSWWQKLGVLAAVVEAIQVVGGWKFAVATVSAAVATVAGYFEGIQFALLIPIFGGTFFIFLSGLISLADRLARWSAAKRSNPGMTVDEFLAASKAQRDFFEWDAAWQSRNHLGSSLLAHMGVWKGAKSDEDIERCRKATAAFLTVTFGKDIRSEFFRQISLAEPEHKTHVALSYLHGLIHRTISDKE